MNKYMTDEIDRGVAREYYYNNRHEKSVATFSTKSVCFYSDGIIMIAVIVVGIIITYAGI
jgi:hypothetical protein